MNQYLTGTIVLAIGILLGIVITAIVHRVRRQLAKQADLERRVTELEGCQKKRLPYATAAGVEDGIAVCLDVVRQFQDGKLRAEQMLAILQQVRGGPENYDPERPAGPRPDGLKTEAQIFAEMARRNRGER